MAVPKPCRGQGGGLAGGSAAPSNYCSSSAASPTTTSTSITDTVNGSHHFTINGYSLSKGMGIGKYIASETFVVGGYEWAIYFYPDGKSAEDNSLYVSLFIALASEGTDVRALFELMLLDQSGKQKHKTHTHFDWTLESRPYTLKYRWFDFSGAMLLSFVMELARHGFRIDMILCLNKCWTGLQY